MLLLNEKQIQAIAKLLFESSALLLQYDRSKLLIHKKKDGTNVTNADLEINDHIISHLQKYYTEIPILSEEADSNPYHKELINSKKPFFCLDPIDGTNSFINGTDEYVISLGILENGSCSYGWIAVPSTEHVYYRMYNKVFKFFEGKHIPITRKKPNDAYIMPKANKRKVTASNREKFIFQSSALKFISFIEGHGKYLIQTHHTKLWDVVAGFAFLECFGFNVMSSDNHKKLKLNSIEVPPFYVNNV